MNAVANHSDGSAPQPSVTLRCDASPIEALLAELKLDLEGAVHIPREVLQELVGLGDVPEEFIALQVDSLPASGAGEMIVRLQPTDRFRRLVATLGAGHVD